MTDHNTDNYGIAPPGYRLPAELALGRVVLQVADVDRSAAYYERVLGLRRLSTEPGVVMLGPQESGTTLLELRELPGAVPVPSRGRLGLYHFALLLPDRASLGRFVAHLATIGERAGMSDHLVSEAVYLTDPDGLGIEVYADRPRATWRHQGRELAMATNPLDVADLVRAAEGTPWTGAPAGTVMGHVHLFVSDLELAAGFYHQALGFDKTVWSYPGALFLSAGGYHHHLGTNTWARGAPVAGEGDARMIEWELKLPAVSDVHQAIRSVSAAGFWVQEAPDGGRCRDPWGVSIRLIPNETLPEPRTIR